MLRTISKIAGGQVVADTVQFFTQFEGMEEGFRERAATCRTAAAFGADLVRPGVLAPAGQHGGSALLGVPAGGLRRPADHGRRQPLLPALPSKWHRAPPPL